MKIATIADSDTEYFVEIRNRKVSTMAFSGYNRGTLCG